MKDEFLSCSCERETRCNLFCCAAGPVCVCVRVQACSKTWQLSEQWHLLGARRQLKTHRQNKHVDYFKTICRSIDVQNLLNLKRTKTLQLQVAFLQLYLPSGSRRQVLLWHRSVESRPGTECSCRLWQELCGATPRTCCLLTSSTLLLSAGLSQVLVCTAYPPTWRERSLFHRIKKLFLKKKHKLCISNLTHPHFILAIK